MFITFTQLHETSTHAKGIRTEALARIDEMVSLHVIAFKMEDIGGNGEMDFFNVKLPKASNQHSVFNVNIMLALQMDAYICVT